MSQIAYFLQGQSLIFNHNILVILNTQFEPRELENVIALVSTPTPSRVFETTPERLSALTIFSVNKEENR